ncbi:phosphatase PAP2 family protein [Georgenia ruanii]|uniref:Phosphatase PAP2 family protein n=2 Tax=Georgenia ruanii TaxID=348442 RepID=A0A7J9V118_9MICO|nr:phosphatase PAP2 family protein [Georgenia ruanii]
MAIALGELGALDRAVFQAVAQTPTPHLDDAFRRLSLVANRSRLWLGTAAAIAVLGGRRGRLAAVEGVLSIAATSAAVNMGIKPLVRRRRPQRVRSAWQWARSVPTPGSTSFPSGHSASAFAFAYAVGRQYPVLAVPIGLVATAVAYSRVHTGVHYPSDVILGSIVGAGTAAVVTSAYERTIGASARQPVHGRPS